MELPDAPVSPTLPREESSVAEWNEAYETVESYFRALGLRNRLLLSTCIHRVLRQAMQIIAENQAEKPSTVAIRAAMELVAGWFQQVLETELPENRLAARGRLALFLADMQGKWQPWFLSDPPWPEEFVKVMRQSYLTAGPAFQERTMTPLPIELNPLLSGATEAWENLDRVPIVKHALSAVMLLIVILTAVILVWA